MGTEKWRCCYDKHVVLGHLEEVCGQNAEEFAAFWPEKLPHAGAEFNRTLWWALEEKTTERIMDSGGLVTQFWREIRTLRNWNRGHLCTMFKNLHLFCLCPKN